MEKGVANLKVYKSSAGSGKTFTLSKNYLTIALSSPTNPTRYREILAITFTNKAAKEMKGRVIEYLDALSSSKELEGGSKVMQELLLEELNIPVNELQRRADKTIKHLLHNYSDFNITTIDKFIVRIVRAFNIEMRLSHNFDIELNDNELTLEAFELLTSDIGIEKEITSYFLNFQKEQIDEDSNWNVKDQLIKIYKEAKYGIGEEKLKAMQKYSYEDFNNMLQSVQEQVKIFDHQFDSLVQNLKESYNLQQFDPKDLNGGKKGILGVADKIFNKTEKFKSEVLKTELKFSDPDFNWVNEKASISESDIEPTKGPFLKLMDYKLKELPRYRLLKSIQKNLFPFTLIHYLHQKLQEVKMDKNVVLLSEFNEKINEIVLKEPIPFIYERIGERYKNYLIDEFQDTSTNQWQNLLPLIENALSYGEVSLIVGDAKQAIYRWRGGEVDQFAYLPAPPEAINNPVVLERYRSLQRHFDHSVQPLSTNYRSKPEVIQFNNEFFQQLLKSTDTKENFDIYYADVEQQIGSQYIGGKIALQIIEKGKVEDYYPEVLEEIKQIIKTSDQKGHKRSSIAILCRTKKEINALAELLINEKISISTVEGLKIVNSETVKFLIHAFFFLFDQRIKNAKLFCSNFLLQKSTTNALILNEQLETLNEINTFQEFLNWFNIETSMTSSSSLKALSHFEIFEELIDAFQLNREDPYVQTLLECILNLGQISVQEVAEWWDENKNKTSINSPEEDSAIQLMTVHKSKGLEFGTVIIADFSSLNKVELHRSSVWIDGQLSGLPFEQTLIQGKKDLLNEDIPNAEPVHEIEQELYALELDSLNNIYVAFTRAVNHLFVFSQKDKVLQKYITANSSEKNCFSKGDWAEPKNKDEKSNQTTPFLSSSEEKDNWRNKIKVSYSAPTIWNVPANSAEFLDETDPRKYGNLIHLLFSKIDESFDYNKVISNTLSEGLISDELHEEVRSIFRKANENKSFQAIWKSGSHYSERELIDSNGKVLRPDLLIENENGWTVVDYKTGESLEKDKKQIRYYANQIELITNQNCAAFLYYTEKNELVSI